MRRNGLFVPAALLVASIAWSCAASPPREAAGGGRRDPVRVEFWSVFSEATAARMRGDLGAAENAYGRALSLVADHEDSLYYLGHCRQSLGRHDAAREAFERLVAVNPHSARGHLALGALLAAPESAGALDLGGAERHLRRAHEINGEETGSMLRIAEILILRGEPAEALRWLESAARTNPKSVEAPFLIGYLRWEEGDATGAARALRVALQASKVEAPVKGVLSEGDRRNAPAGAGSPMGRTLFGPFTAPLSDPAARPSGGTPIPLDRVYAPLRQYRQELSRRAAS